MSSRDNVETFFCVQLGMTPTQTYGKMTADNMTYKVSWRLISSVTNVSEMGKESLEDDSRSGRPVNVKWQIWLNL